MSTASVMPETGQLTIRIRIEGVVQGVGFRPFVAVAADACRISGYVRNAGGAVEILATGNTDDLEAFRHRLKEHPPEGSRIFRYREMPEAASPADASVFCIVESVADSEALRMPTPDAAVCPTCAEELFTRGNRRYLHPFISCTRCGPRYSILEDLPYDRSTTSMRDFPMCPACEAEYRSPADRRYHSQTSACPACGPRLFWHVTGGTGTDDAPEEIRDTRPKLKDALSSSPAPFHDIPAEPAGELTGLPATPDWLPEAPAPIRSAAVCLAAGGIVAVKGIGGYHLICNPFREDAVLRLRAIKQRDRKPFAILYPDLAAVQRHADVDDEERGLLLDSAAPIVLLAARDRHLFPAPVLMGSRHIGAFLPATPVQLMLARAFGPIIATSANRSDDPLIADDDEMLDFARTTGIDAVLSNDRRILVPQDDSVMAVVAGRRMTIRRGRGLAPLAIPFSSGDADSDEPVSDNGHLLAVGADLKASWCMVRDGMAYTGEYLGDRFSAPADARWEQSMRHMRTSLRLEPAAIGHDLHPGYVSTQRALQMTADSKVGFQHHYAHILSVMAEHGIQSPVIGLAFDGVGLGTDGTIWGSEFLVTDGRAFRLAAHLAPIEIPGGNRASRDGALCAWSHLKASGIPWPARLAEPEGARLLEAALKHGTLVHRSSSMGRLFDAVSCLLGICEKSRYEGEAAILLEDAAARALAAGLAPEPAAVQVFQDNGLRRIAMTQALRAMAAGEMNADRAGRLALGFHDAIVETTWLIVSELARETGIRTICASGGVFQNRLLLHRLIDRLERDGYTVLVNRDVPPNDAGIALGQAYGLALGGNRTPDRRGNQLQC